MARFYQWRHSQIGIEIFRSCFAQMKFLLIAVAVAVLAVHQPRQGTVPKMLDRLMDRVVTPPPETFDDCRKARLPNGKPHVRCFRDEGQTR
jgi:hypothetical protein